MDSISEGLTYCGCHRYGEGEPVLVQTTFKPYFWFSRAFKQCFWFSGFVEAAATSLWAAQGILPPPSVKGKTATVSHSNVYIVA